MSAISGIHTPGRNRLLDLLSETERERLFPGMQRITAEFGELVFRQDEPLGYVDFPLSAVISVVVIMEDGAVVETGTIGNEGMAGLPLLLGAERSPAQAFYQVPGEALRMSADAFTEELERGGRFREVMQRFGQAFLNQVAQAAACNRLHPVDQRLCKWILMSHDRVDSDELLLTQEVLAQMLGVRRASVTVAAGMLQKAGFVRYSRGVIKVLDRAALEASACECYRVVRAEQERLLV
jgi:CRP-like cAMP-binding protein